MRYLRFQTAFYIICALTSCEVMAEPATPVNIHGQLLSSSGTPVSGSRAFTVSFFDAATAGNAIGTAITGNVEVSADGLFNLAVQPPSDIYATAEVWYALGVDTDDPADDDASDDIFPSRIRVYYVPLAVQALRALSVDAANVGQGTVDNTELGMLDGVTSNVQDQIDAIDTAAITQHTTDIATNTTNIATNTTNIATNTSDIADNTSAIATNTSDIATNTSAIALKANSADVYTQSAADAKFVELAGDSMSGTLGVNTIAEATASSGVTIEGVKLQDNIVELTSITAPAVTTGKLYRTGADLFWNGAQLNGGGGSDTDTMNWTGYVYDFGGPLAIFKQEMVKAGTILSFQAYCGGNSSNTTVDLKKNGTSILTTSPAAMVTDTLITPALSTASFAQGDVLEFEVDGTTADLKAVNISIVVEY